MTIERSKSKARGPWIGALVMIAFAAVVVAAYFVSPRNTERHVYLFAVQGMHCKDCVDNITARVKKLSGVKDVQVSLQEARARVVCLGNHPTPDEIIAAIQAGGYTATQQSAATTQPAGEPAGP
jgi:copper chaperone CopZ